MNGHFINGSFTREHDIDLIDKTLLFHQKIEGDVSCVVWDASIVLAKYLEELCGQNTGFLKNKNVLELGAGLGLVGLTAACLGANVLLTDLPEALPLLKLNIDSNKSVLFSCKGAVKFNSLNWGEKYDNKFNPDIVLMADCIYYKESIGPLIKTLTELTTKDTTIIMSQELRDTEKQKEVWEFFKSSVQIFFNFHVIPIEEHNSEYCSRDILLVKLRKL
ncbi:unnamed protein product [Brassicogethes aeneus]|uniref:Uncharacterized protein n=1 Tax=Brassicogethes aeneus TaxID=1431903 RepID=A0A9P0B9B7_BRAAE|nr:unnamed protein product [Brassicogethes aeneus]